MTSDTGSEVRTGASIRVTRDGARSKDRGRAYTVFVDNVAAGEVRRRETADIPVRPGEHVVRVSVDFEHSREWHVSLAAGAVVSFTCRSRGKASQGRVDLFLADPSDKQARVRPLDDEADRDMARKHRVVTRDGQVLWVWAHRSGYLRSLDPGASSTDGDAFLLEMALYILVLPVAGLVRWLRHRLLFKRGWSVGVVRNRRFLWPKKVRLERCRTEAEARARAADVMAELEQLPT